MAKYHRVEGISPRDLAYFTPRPTVAESKAVQSAIKGLKQPDLLNEDRDIYNSIIMNYMDKAVGISENYRNNKNYDIEGETLKLRNQLSSEFNSGIIAHLRKRKSDYDIYTEAAKKAQTPQEYAQAIQAIKIEPAIQPDGTYGNIKFDDFYSTRDDHNFEKGLNAVIRQIKPNEIVEEWIKSDDFAESKMDTYTQDTWRTVALQKVSNIAENYIKGSEEYQRWQNQNPNIPLRNEDGSFNLDNKFGLKASAVVEANSYQQSEQITKAFIDPEERLRLVRASAYQRAAGAIAAQPTFVTPHVDNTFATVGKKKGARYRDKNTNVSFYSETPPTGANIEKVRDEYSKDQKDKIIENIKTAVTGINGVKVGGTISAIEGVDPNTNIKVRVPSGKAIYIDLTKTEEEIKAQIKDMLTAMGAGTAQKAKEINN